MYAHKNFDKNISCYGNEKLSKLLNYFINLTIYFIDGSI